MAVIGAELPEAARAEIRECFRGTTDRIPYGINEIGVGSHIAAFSEHPGAVFQPDPGIIEGFWGDLGPQIDRLITLGLLRPAHETPAIGNPRGYQLTLPTAVVDIIVRNLDYPAP